MKEGERLLVLEDTVMKLRAAGKEAATQKSAVEEALAREKAESAAAKLQLKQATAALQVRSRGPCTMRRLERPV